jgi:pyridoxamine 5'-phosphate oxidase
MTLATVDRDGNPAARMVLLKGHEEGGFHFYTNYGSRKAADLAQAPRAALCFWWPSLERQVRISGAVEKLSSEKSLSYFASRPRGAQVGAIASKQSAVLESREELERSFAEVEKQHEGRNLQRPEHWGGYLVRPVRFEFWQGRSSRLHDRIEYVRKDQTWLRRRLSP